MIDFTPTEVATYYRERVPSLKPQGNKLRGPCPVHGGNGLNFSVDPETGRAFCHSKCREEGWDILGLEQALSGKDFRAAKQDVFDIVGRVESGNHHGNTLPSVSNGKSPIPAASQRERVRREGWNLVAEGYFGDDLRQVRYEHPTITQADKGKPEKKLYWEHRREDSWFLGAGGKTIPPYLNGVARNRDQVEEITLTEGWGKADALGKLDIPAGSLKEIKAGNAAQFAGFRRITIWPDRDAEGARQAASVAELLRKHNKNVCIIEPPASLPPSGDVIDAIALGWTGEKIRVLIASATGEKNGNKICRVEDVPQIETFESVGIEWDIDGIIARGGFTLLTGESGAGKTTWITAASHAIAHGLTFMGRATSKRPVLMLDAENGLSAVVERCQRLGISTSDDFRIWGQWVGDEPPAPGSAILYDWVERCPVKPVLVVDNLIAFCPSAENNSEDMRRYLAPCRKLASMGCSVVLLHHTGKGETSRDYRGSSDIKASVDVAFRLTNLGDGTKLSIMELKPFKQRFTVTPQLTIRYDEGTFSVDNQGMIARTVTERLVELLRANPRISAAEFQKLANDQQLGRNRARTFLESPAVKCETGDKNRHFYTWIGGDE